jgi:hypothetical protein
VRLAKRRRIRHPSVSCAPVNYVTVAKTVFDIEIDGLRRTRACFRGDVAHADSSTRRHID